MDSRLLNENENQLRKIKISVLGKGVVGKSSLTYRFLNYNTPKNRDPTIEDRYKVQVDVGGIPSEIEILDTAGEEDYQGMIDMWINFGEGFLLVFALNDKESFELLEKKRERILKVKKDIISPIVVVGNKSDLVSERVVKEDLARETARKWGAEYIETSAETNTNCKECFQLLAKMILKSTFATGVSKSKKKCPCC